LHRGRAGEPRHLDGDRPVEARVVGQVDRAHAAPAEPPADLVAAEPGREHVGRRRLGGGPRGRGEVGSGRQVLQAADQTGEGGGRGGRGGGRGAGRPAGAQPVYLLKAGGAGGQVPFYPLRLLLGDLT